MTLTGIQLVEAAMIGLSAGLIGGLAGIGGSLVMLPLLGLWFGYADASRSAHHVYMAAAMCVNVLVAIPATLRHERAGAVRRDLVRLVLPVMVPAIIAGVLLSDAAPGLVLTRVLAAFIAVHSGLALIRALRSSPTAADRPAPERVGSGRARGTGVVAGLVGGLLGIGGGVVMVPMFQVLCRVPLRQAIGSSAAIMCVTALIGATAKVAGLPAQGKHVWDALLLVALMGPGAVVGGMMGAAWTHALPIRAVRAIVACLLLAAAARLAV